MNEISSSQTAQSILPDTLDVSASAPLASSSFAIMQSSESTSIIQEQKIESVLSSSEIQKMVDEFVPILPLPKSTETIETIDIPPAYDSWIEKPLNDYTVTEGLLLLIVIFAIAAAILKLFKIL